MFGINKVEDLHFIFFGYQQGAHLNNEVGDELTTFFSNFEDYVNKHFESKNDVDWSRLIRFYSDSDKHSLELFSNLYTMYYSLNFKN
ncbi:MAG: hypothetical protein H7331_09090 [Bacteroidia bacterium]|nr:hypothetical protein [Bacteroidia bacterium]